MLSLSRSIASMLALRSTPLRLGSLFSTHVIPLSFVMPDCFTCLLDPCCPTYSMYVTGGRVGYVIVYNVSYSLDVESTGCDVRRDKDSLASGSESCQRRLAHGLGFSSMYQADLQTHLSQ